jgi:hypothetical protein
MKKFSFLACALALAPALFAAPVYSVGNSVPCGTGMVITVWNAETPTPGNGTTAASQQVSLINASIGKPGTPFSIDGQFSGAPGAFEVDVQVAAKDADTNYQTVSNGNITTVDATNNTFHLDYSGNAKFVRLLMRTRTNSVTVTATVTGG